LGWTHEYDLKLNEVWSSAWFKATELSSSEVPVLAMINPLDHKVLYFVQEEKIFTVDVRSPSKNRHHIAKFKIDGSAGDCRSSMLHSYVTPIETFELVPRL
jgi:hypothetical protein